jgi:hypothetical protein
LERLFVIPAYIEIPIGNLGGENATAVPDIERLTDISDLPPGGEHLAHPSCPTAVRTSD